MEKISKFFFPYWLEDCFTRYSKRYFIRSLVIISLLVVIYLLTVQVKYALIGSLALELMLVDLYTKRDFLPAIQFRRSCLAGVANSDPRVKILFLALNGSLLFMFIILLILD